VHLTNYEYKTINSPGDETAKRDVLHILASPGYAPGTIALSVTRMERGFNAGQTHSSIYPSIFNRLLAIARYRSEIATFSYVTPLHLTPPVGVIPLDDLRDFWWVSCRMARL